MCIPPVGVCTRRVSGNGPSCASVPNPSTLLWASPVSTSITTKLQPQSSAIQAFGHCVHHVMIVSGSQLAATCQFRMREILLDRHGTTRQPRPAYCKALSSAVMCHLRRMQEGRLRSRRINDDRRPAYAQDCAHPEEPSRVFFGGYF